MIDFMAMAEDSSQDSNDSYRGDKSPLKAPPKEGNKKLPQESRKPFSDVKSGTVSRSKSSSITAENIQKKKTGNKAKKPAKGKKKGKEPPKKTKVRFLNNVAGSTLTQEHSRLTYKNVEELEKKIEHEKEVDFRERLDE